MASAMATKCTARTVMSQAETIAPVVKVCLTPVGQNLTPPGQNTSSGETEHAQSPSGLSRCLTKQIKYPLSDAANIKPVDFSEKVTEACLNKKLDEKDRSLCAHIMKRLQEKKHLCMQVGKLTIMFRSCDPVVITFGEGDQDLLALIENEKPSLIQTIPETVMYTCPAENQHLEGSDVRNATNWMFLCEEDDKLVKDIELLISKKTEEPRQQIKDVDLTFYLKNGSTIKLCHGNQNQKLHVINDDGKPTFKWECRKEPDDIMNKISDAFQNVELSESDKSLHINVMKLVAEEKNRLPFSRLRVVLECGKEILIEIGEGDTEFLVFTENGKTKWIPPFVPDDITYTSENTILEGNDIKRATKNRSLDEEETRLVKFAEATVNKKNGSCGLQIRNVILTISSENGRQIQIMHGDKSQRITIMTVKGEPDWTWGHREWFGKCWENIYESLAFNNIASIISMVINFIPGMANAFETIKKMFGANKAPVPVPVG